MPMERAPEKRTQDFSRAGGGRRFFAPRLGERRLSYGATASCRIVISSLAETIHQGVPVPENAAQCRSWKTLG
jgi:hypothetical protein